MAVTKCGRLFFSLLLLTLLMDLRVICRYNDEEGDECEVSSDISGVCTVVYKCALALSAIKKGRKHRMKTCGFTDDEDEIVCCPTTGVMVKSQKEETTTSGNSNRKCDKFCEEISKVSLSFVQFHIIAGKDAAEEEFPHMAALGYNIDDEIQWNCGASIISKNSLLTAAHCFTKQVQPTKVRVGVTKLNDTNFKDFDIKNITIHERYSVATKHNDIAVVRIKGEMKFSKNIYPACLYHEDDDPPSMTITGWGKTSIDQEDDRSNVLQKATVVAYDLDKCNTIYSSRSSGTKTIGRSQLCAGSPPESEKLTDACWGDSGGPCQIRNKLQTYSIVGIISYGQQCASQTPGVYTRVSEYIDWIEKLVWN